MRENPVISDRVPIRGDLTEGSLGGRLAQRLAALREVMAAGARFISCLPSCSSALLVPLPIGEFGFGIADTDKRQIQIRNPHSTIRKRQGLPLVTCRWRASA